MVEAATDGYPKFKACDFEFHLPRPSYTVDTLRRLREAYPQREFVLIIGADNWTSFDRWKCPEEILSHHLILIYPRSGHPVATETLPSGVRLINTPLMEISSTFIREAIGQEKTSASSCIPKYIALSGSTGSIRQSNQRIPVILSGAALPPQSHWG